MPSASNRLRHEYSDCGVVPYRFATSPIGDPPSTPRTAPVPVLRQRPLIHPPVLYGPDPNRTDG